MYILFAIATHLYIYNILEPELPGSTDATTAVIRIWRPIVVSAEDPRSM